MKLLIAYFSWSGHTERIAKMLAVKTRGRLFRIERNPPYSTDYETCSEVEGKADAEEKLRPALKLPLPDIRTFDAIFLAFPIWYYTYPGVIRSFLSSYPGWMGKPIYIFPNSLDEDPGFLPNTMKEAEKDAKKCRNPSRPLQQGIEEHRRMARLAGFLRTLEAHQKKSKKGLISFL